ncbi:sigma-54 dependent transcriptional regulator [Halorhodospira halophila]|uniref:Sigma54 specific transcriptional regulator, Fis family n=1 Tax=Halorhodospira halophila (strain DSM 244 / SL1) TaxID=349124 RepID=A1WV02_HALHL|nr:sigma-54 dependent transcriptional regulator [Halorhodospira halophila]ABM61514.1 sigma54 specific transcriptional regulator, Fis family [Halorhodospira halophila SL1]MBK1728762.1 sigma-54-dependent Fis family transcriptional regulator [Halorhodospira halophila]
MGAPTLVRAVAGLRSALSVHPGKTTPALQPSAAPPGWDLTPVEDWSAIERLLTGEHPPVGLVRVTAENVEACQRFLAGGAGVEWLALCDPPDGHNQDAVEALLASAFYDFHTLPADPERLAVSLGHAAGMAQLRRHTRSRQAELTADTGGILGDSPGIQALRRDLAKVARCPATVLIHGESGSGKELAAQAIHHASPRRDGPFVAVNCGAIPANLVQTELFGHERGAFTGAQQRRCGHLERAQGGTILLDEVGELTLEHQVNLLRVLEDRAVTRVGGTERIPVDVRVIAATHVDLAAAVESGHFREDLYYRLNVLHIELPPLRERGNDIERLAHVFLERFRSAYLSPVRGFTSQALGALRRHSWPGNVRELINRIQRAVAMGQRALLSPGDLGLEARLGTVRQAETLDDARARAERAAILGALARCERNVSRAARELDISRVTLYRIMHRLGLRP